MEPDWCAPEACSLDSAQQPARVAEWDHLFAVGVRAVTPVDGGVRLDLAPARGQAAAVADLADREAQCCLFFRFDLAIADETLALTIRTDPAYGSVVDALAARALARVGSGE